jgi:hypothetical protein
MRRSRAHGERVIAVGAGLLPADAASDDRIDLQEEALALHALEEHAVIPMAFVVDRILEVTPADGGLGGLSLTETVVPDPYVKDYDAIEGAGPAHWLERFDISNWGLICADVP